MTRYAHLHTIAVKKGQEVKEGQLIGSVGSTGHVRASGRDPSHLHFELYVEGKRVDPLTMLKKESALS
jgi:murein DD-endopeptidase MepM/ murein hydrolase activator NlpD